MSEISAQTHWNSVVCDNGQGYPGGASSACATTGYKTRTVKMIHLLPQQTLLNKRIQARLALYMMLLKE